ncbi:MAG: hypothetical protein E5W70_30820 [Mesorhizobium sp.]|nr:MAG: hypothetical protein E5W70_30820 [Mesorhizobium sp.]
MPAIDLLEAPAAYEPDEGGEDDPNILMAQGQAFSSVMEGAARSEGAYLNFRPLIGDAVRLAG